MNKSYEAGDIIVCSLGIHFILEKQIKLLHNYWLNYTNQRFSGFRWCEEKSIIGDLKKVVK